MWVIPHQAILRVIVTYKYIYIYNIIYGSLFFTGIRKTKKVDIFFRVGMENKRQASVQRWNSVGSSVGKKLP